MRDITVYRAILQYTVVLLLLQDYRVGRLLVRIPRYYRREIAL